MSYQEIDRGPLWTGRIHLARQCDPAELQATVNDLVAQSLTTVTGYYRPEPASITLTRWPESRPGYLPAPSDGALVLMLGKLADRLDTLKLEYDIVASGRLHVLLGRKMDGYGDGELAPVSAYHGNVAGYFVHEGHMITARVNTEHGLVSYDEPAVIIEADAKDEPLIHAGADRTHQHHYAVEHGASGSAGGYVALFETSWAQ
jgi:hypothetical protein